MQHTLRTRGTFHVEAFDPVTGQTLWRERVKNAATLAGLTAMLQDFFAAGTQKTQWFVGLIDATGFTAVSTSDTMSAHSGWTEFTSYSSATRPQWTPLSVSAGIIANTLQVVYTMTAAASLRGVFLVSNSTKAGTTGTLWCTGLFGSSRTLASGNGLRITYTGVLTGGNA